MRIVWIDDDAWVLRPLVDRLIQEGHDVRRVRTVGEALETVDEWRDYDLVLLDVILPPGGGPDWGTYSGIPLLRELRTRKHLTLPAIILSVVDSGKMTAELEGLGVVAKLRKPTLPSLLKQALSTVSTANRPEPMPAGAQLRPVGY